MNTFSIYPTKLKRSWKPLLLLIINYQFFIFNCFSQNPLVKQWDYRFGGSLSDNVTCCIHTLDNGILLAGHSLSDSSGDKTMHNWDVTLTTSDFWLVKIDYAGNKQWDKRFGSYGDDLLMTIQQTGDGGYIAGGPSISAIGGDKTQDNCNGYNTVPDFWIIKIDSLGNKLWDKRYGGEDGDVLRSISLSPDKGFMLGGYSLSQIDCEKTQNIWNYSVDYWIAKTDSFGNKLWDKDLGGYMHDFLYSIQATDDRGYILGGESYSDSSGNKTRDNLDVSLLTSDYWIVKIDSLGNKQWDKSYGGINADRFKVMRQTPDKGFIIGGITISDSSGDVSQHTRGWWDYWIVKTDSLGNKQWDKRFGGSNSEDDFDDIAISGNGHYMLCGTSYSDASGDKSENNMGAEQMWIVMIDSAGNKIWDKTIFTDSILGHEERGLGVFLNHDSCYAFAAISSAGIGGYKSQPSQGQHDYWIIKFCDSTSTNGAFNLHPPTSNFQIFPNPSNGIFQINFPNQKTNYTLKLLNTLGQKVYTSEIINHKAEITLDLTFLPKGIYVLKINDGEVSLSKKLIIQ